MNGMHRFVFAMFGMLSTVTSAFIPMAQALKKNQALTGMALILGMFLMPGLVRADIPKSGTIKLTYGFNVSGNVQQFSDTHLFWQGTFKGAAHNSGSDVMKYQSWDCYGTNEIKDGMADANGFCTAVDPDGDKIFVKYGGKYDVTKPFTGEGIYFGGTGKYNGISGVNKFQCNTIGSNAVCTSELKYTIK